jgi:predicted permease
MLQDLRYALRAFRRAPAFTAAAVLSLALGIGVNTSIFSVVNGLLLRPLPYQDAERLVILWNRSPGIGIAEDWFSTAQYFDIKNGHQGLEDVAIAIGANWNLTGDGEPERIGTLRVSSNLLPMLGVRPALGDLFGPDDDRPGRTGRALLSHGTWIRRYGGDRGVLGRSLTLNGQPYEVIGVLPASFDLPREVMPTLGGAEHAEIVLPLPLGADAAHIRNGEDYNIIGRLKSGVPLEQAQAEMDAITARLRGEHPQIYPANGGLTFSLVPLQEQVVGDVRRSLFVLIGSVAFVLLIACANVANLLLSRSLAREGEIAVRTAMGAGRSRLVRQFLTESILLGLMGGLLGLVLATSMLSAIRLLGSSSVPRLHEIAIDTNVLLFTLIVSLVSAVAFGLAPAMRLSRLGLTATLIASGRRTSETGTLWSGWRSMRRLLVAGELALCVMLLVGAGLLIRSFSHLEQVPPGFNASNVLTLELTMTGRRYADAERVIQTYRDLWNRLAVLPGVTAVGGVSMLPLSQMFAWGPIVLENRPLPSGESFVNVDQRTVGGDYFGAMQIALLKGRVFTEQDTRQTPRVVIVDDHMAQALWPNEDPIGKRLRRGGMDAASTAPWLTVVGVVGRIKQYALDERDSRIAMYHPHTQAASRAMNIVIRGGNPEALTATAMSEIRAVDPELPIYNVKTMERRVDESLGRRRFAMLLLTLFAAVALVLASVGIYGVISYFVSQGARDIGIRMALGATPHQILGMVVGQGATVIALGVSVGLAGAVMLGSALDNLLFGIESTDPMTFAVVSVLLAGVAMTGSYIPARRAARIDPASSLRSE